MDPENAERHVEEQEESEQYRSASGTAGDVGPLGAQSPSVVEIVSPGDKKNLGAENKGVAAFIGKLYSMVEDEKCQHLLHWTNNGGFVVVNPEEFSRLVLPHYFKHNNFASFVRQLNMYGFHKVNDFINVNPGQETQSWEFNHPSFQKGKRELLHEIKRKVSQNKNGSPGRFLFGSLLGSPSSNEMDGMAMLEKTFKDQKDSVSILSMRVIALEDKLKQTTDANQALYNDVFALRQQVAAQHSVLMQMATFLTQTFNDESQAQTGQKRKRFSLEPSMVQAMSAAAAAAANTTPSTSAASLLAAAAAADVQDQHIES